MKVAIITAGGAGMFCGSCMQDNTLARGLRMAGADAVLVPTYTPIRVDEENVSSPRVFLGGINVWLDSAVPGWRRLPVTFTRWLDRPSVIRWLSKFGNKTDASKLGSLTIDLLKGSHGPQQREIDELVSYLVDDLKPDVILFSNALLSGIVPGLRQRFRGTLLTLLQGDDIFLEGLPSGFRSQAIQLVSDNSRHFDAVLCHSEFYSRFMQNYLRIPGEKFHRIPLAVDEIPGVIGSRPVGVRENSGAADSPRHFTIDRPVGTDPRPGWSSAAAWPGPDGPASWFAPARSRSCPASCRSSPHTPGASGGRRPPPR